jgi:hypothetical protein
VGFLQLLKGTPRAVPDSSPRASAGSPSRLPQMLEPADRTSFPPGLQMLSVEPRQRTRGSSPRSPVGAWALLQGFYRETWSEGMVHVSTSVGSVLAGFSDACAAGTVRGRCDPGGVAVRRAPEPGPVRGDRVELCDFALLDHTGGRRVRFPQPPSVGSRIADSSLSC